MLMNYQGHLIFSLVVNGVVLFILHSLGLSVELSLPLIAAFGIFTLLPDIDSRNSIASRLLFMVLGAVFLGSIAEILVNGLNLLSGGGIVLTISLFLIHLVISRDDRLHRAFPHTLAFGAIACAAFFLISGSFLATLVAAISFLSHVVADKHIRLV